MSKAGALKKLMDIISPVRPQRIAQSPRAVDVAAELRGGTQPAAQLLQQLKGQPGIKASDLKMWGGVPGTARMSPLELAARAEFAPMFAQRGHGGSPMAPEEAAWDLIWGESFRPQRNDLMRQFLTEGLGTFSKGDQTKARKFIDAENPTIDDFDKMGALLDKYVADGAEEGWYNNKVANQLSPKALEIAESQYPQNIFDPAYKVYQRQPASENMERAGGEYFETVLRGRALGNLPGKRASEVLEDASYHFDNPQQLGHIRGTASPDRLLIDEIQSDPLEFLGSKHPSMQNIYGKLGNMIVDRAAAANIPLVSVPDAARIASVRDSDDMAFFRKLYNKEMDKALYTPLSLQGLRVNKDDGWFNIELPEAAREAIRRGELLRYKRGGLNKVSTK
jgi:hypothetical protein